MIRKTIFLTLISLPLLAFVLYSAAHISVVHGCEVTPTQSISGTPPCSSPSSGPINTPTVIPSQTPSTNPTNIPSGDYSDCGGLWISADSVAGNTATVTNYATTPNGACQYQAMLALYDSPTGGDQFAPNFLEAQKLINYTVIPVPEGATKTITVSGTGTSCWEQADVIFGYNSEVLTPLTPPYYSNRPAAVFNICITPTPSVVPSSTPTATLTPGPTATPTPGSSSGSSNGSSNSGSGSGGGSNSSSNNSPQPMVQAMAFTGNALMTYAVILTGAASLISGMILRKIGS